MSGKKRDEEAEQIVLMEWLSWFAPNEYRWTHHSPNGGHRAKKTAVQMKKLGTKPGFPDLVMYVPRGEFQGLVVEMKATQGGKPTENQCEWIDHFVDLGWLAVVCQGFEAAQKTIKSYLELPLPGEPNVPQLTH